ncbi:MAG: Lipopolysaccharide core biosynthesis protein RfaG [Chlamydiae bacterium]|nr:Lipopolysaccharide core biosynthesis protein RfaG [Chlamydiota bacterium]
MTRSVTILKSHFTKNGGAEKYARCLADAFHQKGCHVTVLTTGPIDTPFSFEVISHRLKSKTSVSKVWEFEAFCDQYLKKHPSDIVFGMDRNRSQTHLRAGSGSHKAYLEHRKSYESSWKRFRHMINPLHTTLLHMEKTGFEHPDLKVLFTNSNLVKEEILSHFVIDPKKITVIHNGVQWHEWQESFDTWEKDSSHFEFLFIGSDFHRKGLIPLLKGLRQLSERDFHLSIVGSDKNQKHFQHLAQKYGLQKQITFCGAQSDIRPFLQRADCLVIPSFYDPFANVTVEALAMGLFVVSSKTNGGCEVLTPETGCTIEDLKNMTPALEIALKHPKTRQRALLIRESVKHLDFSTQLNTYLDTCLLPTS